MKNLELDILQAGLDGPISRKTRGGEILLSKYREADDEETASRELTVAIDDLVDEGYLYPYLILSQKVCAGRIRTNVPTPGYNIQSLFRILPQHTVARKCAKTLELPQNGFLRGNHISIRTVRGERQP